MWWPVLLCHIITLRAARPVDVHPLVAGKAAQKKRKKDPKRYQEEQAAAGVYRSGCCSRTCVVGSLKRGVRGGFGMSSMGIVPVELQVL